MASLSADQMQAPQKELALAREAGLGNKEIMDASGAIQDAVKGAWVTSGGDFKTFVGNMADTFGWDRKSQEYQAEAMLKDVERVKKGEMSYAEMRGLYG